MLHLLDLCPGGSLHALLSTRQNPFSRSPCPLSLHSLEDEPTIARQIDAAGVSYDRERMVPTTPSAIVEIEALYVQHGPALVLFATSIVGERSRAQDAVHHVFLKLLEGGNLAQVDNKKAYLFSCVRNALLNETRHLQRSVALDADSVWFSAPEKDLAAEADLRRAMLSLPDDQRQIVVLHLWGELTFLEIAEVLEISLNTAASRYRYALDKLREQLAGAASHNNPAKENFRAESR